MFKFFSFIIIILILAGIAPAWSQTAVDSAQIEEINTDSHYQAVADSDHLPSIDVREVPERQVDKFLKDPAFAYANNPQYWKKDSPVHSGNTRSFFSEKPVQWTIFLLFVGILLFGIYQLAREVNFRWLTRKEKQNASEGGEFKTEELIDFDAVILKYQLEGNYRLAVRFMYLRLIRTIREKGKIPIRDSSTNAEISSAFGSRRGANEFRYLATAYEYIFYGGFFPQQEVFDGLKSKFEDFQQTHSA
jgi:hypothetical protein